MQKILGPKDCISDEFFIYKFRSGFAAHFEKSSNRPPKNETTIKENPYLTLYLISDPLVRK